MSSEQQVLSTADLRAAAQDYRRDATQKHKWVDPIYERFGQTLHHPKPNRTSRRHVDHWKDASNKPSTVMRHDIEDGIVDAPVRHLYITEYTGAYDDNAPVQSVAPDAGIMYSFDNASGPASGSQILNSALSKAIEKYEDKETVRLVRKEYDMVNEDDESLGLGPAQRPKGKGKAISLEDDEYEFV